MQQAGRGGDTVRLLVRDEARAEPLTRLGAQAVAGELRDGADVRKAVDGVDAVVNIAASFRGVPDEEAWAVNRDAALDLGRAAVEAGVHRFVQVSTNLVYGAGRGRPAVEDDQPLSGGRHPGAAYPDSKWAAETGLLALDGLDVRIGRLAFVYGEGDPHLAQVVRWAEGWAGHKRLQMVHHADVGQGLLRLLYAPAWPAGPTTSPTTRRSAASNCSGSTASSRPPRPPTARSRTPGTASSPPPASATSWASARSTPRSGPRATRARCSGQRGGPRMIWPYRSAASAMTSWEISKPSGRGADLSRPAWRNMPSMPPGVQIISRSAVSEVIR